MSAELRKQNPSWIQPLGLKMSKTGSICSTASNLKKLILRHPDVAHVATYDEFADLSQHKDSRFSEGCASPNAGRRGDRRGFISIDLLGLQTGQTHPPDVTFLSVSIQTRSK